MTNEVTIKATADGKPLEELERLVRMRAAALHETTREATIATAIQILNSLKTATRKAPLKGRRRMYTIEKSPLVGSWLWSGGRYRRVARTRNGAVDWNVTNHCRNVAGQAHVKGETINVYRIQLFNENLNNTLYYAFARSEKDARNYVENVILARLLRKESGMARYAVGIAQAKVSNRPMMAEKPQGSKAFQTAYDSAWVVTSQSVNSNGVNVESYDFSEGAFFITFIDKLRYSLAALKNGQSTFDTACMKAANKVAGMIHMAFVNKRFDQDVRSPFPEVKGAR